MAALAHPSTLSSPPAVVVAPVPRQPRLQLADRITVLGMAHAELSGYFSEVLRTEQEWIDARVDEGAVFVRSRGKTVHTLDCRAGGYRPSRRTESWSARVPDMNLGEIRQLLANGKRPPMPELLNRVDLALPGASYRRCRVCVPDVPDIESISAGHGSHESVAALLRYGAQKYRDRPCIALLKVLDLHECSLGGTCVECSAVYPCPTVESVRLANAVSGTL